MHRRSLPCVRSKTTMTSEGFVAGGASIFLYSGMSSLVRYHCRF